MRAVTSLPLVLDEVVSDVPSLLEAAGIGGIRVETERGSYAADRLVVAAGAWAASVGRLDPELAVAERNALAWFQPRVPELFGPDRFPCFGLAVEEGIFYGFPQFGVPGLKVGRLHHRHERVDPDDFDREPNAADEALLRSFVERYLPEGAGPTMALKTCLFETARTSTSSSTSIPTTRTS